MSHNDDPTTLRDYLDYVEEECDQALLRIQNYQQTAARYYNKKVRNRRFEVGDLVLRKVYENTMEYNAGMLGTNWEGPYQVTEVARPGIYRLMTIEGEAIPRSWILMSLKKFTTENFRTTKSRSTENRPILRDAAQDSTVFQKTKKCSTSSVTIQFTHVTNYE